MKIQKSITIDIGIYKELQKEHNASQLIESLLRNYYWGDKNKEENKDG